MELSQEWLDQSAKILIKKGLIKRVLLSTIIYSILIALIYLLIEIEFNYLSVAIILVTSFVYSYIKELFLSNKQNQIYLSQKRFLLKEKPEIEFIIPIFHLQKSKFYVRNSVLFIDDSQLYIAAFERKSYGNVPTDYVFARCQNDFYIEDVSHKSDLLIVSGKLMDQEYLIYLLHQSQIEDYLIQEMKQRKEI